MTYFVMALFVMSIVQHTESKDVLVSITEIVFIFKSYIYLH